MNFFIKEVTKILCIIIISMNTRIAFAQETDPFAQWHEVQSVITARENQAPFKMKLSKKQAKLLITYLNTLKPNEIIEIQVLQKTLPKTATELLHAMVARGLDKAEAQKMAAFLQKVPAQYHLKNVAVFDENTSHIIGREWHEIDYSGEGMTWQAQKAKYQPYGITSFKTLSNLQKFFPVESRLPYFYKVYGKNL